MSSPDARPDIIDFPEAISDTFILLDRQWRFVYLNRTALRHAKRPAEALLGQCLWDQYPVLLGTPIEVAYRRAMDEQTAIHFEHRGVITGTWYEIHAYPVRGGLAIYGRDISDRKRAEQAMRDSEERFRTQYENLPVPTYTWQRTGPDFTLIGFNKAAEVATGGAAARLLGQAAAELYRDEPAILDAIRECCERREPVRRDMSYSYRTSGAVRDLAVTFAFVPPDLVLVHTEDVTDRKLAERRLREVNETLEQRVARRTADLEARTEELARSERALRASEAHYRELAERHQRLVLEVEHRVGNNLAGLLGLVAAMRERGGAAGEVAAAMETRLRAMAHIHQLLARGGWVCVDLQTVVRSTLDAMRDLAPAVAAEQVDGAAVWLAPKQAYGMTLILVEWFTNSCKHGVHSVAGGRLQIAWDVAGEGVARRVRLRWVERDGPAVRQPVRPSLGTALVEGFAARELGGRCLLGYPPEGADHLLEFPVG